MLSEVLQSPLRGSLGTSGVPRSALVSLWGISGGPLGALWGGLLVGLAGLWVDPVVGCVAFHGMGGLDLIFCIGLCSFEIEAANSNHGLNGPHSWFGCAPHLLFLAHPPLLWGVSTA